MVFFKARAGVEAGDSVEARRGLNRLKNARLLKQTGAEVIMDGFHNPRTIKIKTNARQLSSIKTRIRAQRSIL